MMYHTLGLSSSVVFLFPSDVYGFFLGSHQGMFVEMEWVVVGKGGSFLGVHGRGCFSGGIFFHFC
mgnify:CR=1 FL=1